MLNLTSAIQNALKISPNQEFRYIVKIARSLVASPYTASHFYISSSAAFGDKSVGIQDTNVYPVIPILLNEPEITENLHIREHTSTVGGFSLVLDDTFKFANSGNSNALEKFSDQLNTYNIYNKDLFIYLWLDGITSLANCQLLYQGIAGDFAIENGKIIIKISNSAFKGQKELPKNIITLNSYPAAPVENIGKAIPLVYGDHSFEGLRSTTPAQIRMSGVNNMVECIQIATGQYLVAAHELKELNSTDIWLYDNKSQKFYNLDSSLVTVYNPDSKGFSSIKINTVDDLIVYDWVCPNNAENHPGNDVDWEGLNAVYDLDVETAASIFAENYGNEAYFSNAMMLVHFPDYYLSERDFKGIKQIELFYRGKYQLLSGDDSDVDFDVYTDGLVEPGETVSIKSITSTSQIHNLGAYQYLPATVHYVQLIGGSDSDTYKLGYDNLAQITSAINKNDSASSIENKIEALDLFNEIEIRKSGYNYEIWYKGDWRGYSIKIPDIVDEAENIKVRVAMQVDGRLNARELIGAPVEINLWSYPTSNTPYIYCEVYAIYKKIKLAFEPLSQIDNKRFKVFAACKGRKASATVAPHFSGLSTGDLLENPVHIIDSIICDELGQTIDTTSAQAVATELASWKLCPVIRERQNSRDILEKIARQAKSICYWNALNKAALDTFFASNTTDYIFGVNDLKERPQIRKTTLAEVVNKLVLKYNAGLDNNLQQVITREDDRSNVGSQAKYNLIYEMTIDADFISNSTTAGLLADHWVKNDADSFWSVLHNLVEFETVDLRGMNFWRDGNFKPIVALELADIIEFSSEWDSVMKLFGQSWSGVQFKIISISRTLKSLKIGAISL